MLDWPYFDFQTGANKDIHPPRPPQPHDEIYKIIQRVYMTHISLARANFSALKDGVNRVKAEATRAIMGPSWLVSRLSKLKRRRKVRFCFNTELLFLLTSCTEGK